MTDVSEWNDAVFRAALEEGSAAAGIPLTSAQVDACSRYAALLIAVNAHTNLTRITEPAAVAVKHFVDSLTVLAAVPDLPEGASAIDVGTGAGFPGLVLKIVRPDLRLTLLDSLGKRLTFLSQTAADLDLDGVTLVHARAEDAAREPAHRDRYDLVTARAVAALPVLLEWCAPFARPAAGRFVAMKSGGVTEELAAAENAALVLNVRLEKDLALVLPPLPGDDEPSARRLLVFRKHQPTPPRYPRRPAEIKEKPL